MKSKGLFLTILSAIIFGVTPIMAKMTYSLGSNGLTLAFLRHFLVIPVLYLCVKLQKQSLKITKTQCINIIKVGIFGSGLTVLTLYVSYSYISVGSATVLHFLYPMFVSLIMFLFFKETLTKTNRMCLIVATTGIVFFIEPGGSSMIGFVLALISAISFAYYIVGIDRLWLNELPSYVLNFYLAIVVSIFIGIVGFSNQTLVIDMPLSVYGYSFIIAVLTSVIGIICLQKGIQYLGAATASILSMFEPTISVIIGIIVLNEQLNSMKIIGCCIILLAITIIVVNNARTKN